MLNADDAEPIGDVLDGLTLLPLGDNVTPIEAVVLVKAIDGDGYMAWYTRWTAGVTAVESIGALHAALILEEDHLRSTYRSRDDEND